MKKSVKITALEIALILEKNTPADIKAAIAWLEEEGYPVHLLCDKRPEAKKNFKGRPTKKPFEEATSQSVSMLEGKDEIKFRILSEFDKRLRTGRLLSDNVKLRDFGRMLSKDFVPKKTKRENIPSILAQLAKMEIEDVKEAIQKVENFDRGSRESDYQDLANFLMGQGDVKRSR